MPRPEFEGRFITLYFSTKDELTHWKNLAAERSVSLPDLITSALEALEKSFEAAPKPDIAKEAEDLKAEVSRLKKELRLQENLIEKYESELYRTRYTAFEEVSPAASGSRTFDLDLIQALKTSRKAMDSGAILATLKIDPGDREAVKLVRNQLETLSRYGLISESSHGWSWKK
jgi:hypothetical protein